MQSSNPVFARSEAFNGKSASGVTYPSYDPEASGYASEPGATYAPADQGRMTIDSVVQKTGMTLGVVVIAAALTWYLTPAIESEQNLSTLYTFTLIGALGGFALAMVNSFKRVISPGLVLAYAAFQGVFVGALSKSLEAVFAEPDGSTGGLVIGAVVGTAAAVAGTLAAYKFFNIRVSDKFRKFVIAALVGFVALAFFDMLLGFFGNSFGFNGFGGLGLLTSVIGLGLGVLMLILDFDYVEKGVAAGLPERESWRAAFGLAVTIIWIYIEMIRILAILRGND